MTFATRAWFTDAHSDFFVRNVLAFCPGLGDDDAVRAANLFEPNTQRVTWPTLDEVTRWDQASMAPTGVGHAGPRLEALELCLAAAIDRIAERIGVDPRPVDADGAVDPDGDPVEIRATVKLAVVMQTVRWAARVDTPTGVAGASELAGVIRVTALDPDIETMLGNQLRVGLA